MFLSVSCCCLAPPTIPANATLKFDVELLSWENTQKVTEDKGVVKKIIKKGEGHNRPNENATVVVKYTAKVKETGHVFEEHKEPTTIHLNSAKNVYGFEEGVKNMYIGEHSVFTIQPSYAYGSTGKPDSQIPPHAVLEFDVELLSFGS